MEILLNKTCQTERNFLKKVQEKATIQLNEKGIKQTNYIRDSQKNERAFKVQLSFLKPDRKRVLTKIY